MPNFFQYRLDSEQVTIKAADLLTIETTPNPTDICNVDITYEILFDGVPVTFDSEGPMRLVLNNNDEVELVFDTNDENLLRYANLEVVAVLPNGDRGCPVSGDRRLQGIVYDEDIDYGTSTLQYGTLPINPYATC